MPPNSAPADLIDPFESPKLLIEGAVEDIEELGIKCRAFVDACTSVAFAEPDFQAGQNVIKFRVAQKIPQRLRYLTSNILNNLRHALDQAINCGAVELGARKRNSYFPFVKDEAELPAALASKCKSVDSRLSDYIVREFKPYGGGDDLLYAMSKCTGPNKHQLTLSLQCDLQTMIWDDRFAFQLTGSGMGGDTLGFLGWDSRKQELEFARIFPGSVLKITGQPHLPLFIAICGSPELGGDVVVVVLRNLASKVRSIVVAIEAETARLKST
ncbi:hypothetical protein IB276_11595 [Ensifer sp. ENS04]|uniref:hypothetical protein n=1 Tax=Ensifer sp. ENS04 TaxID=2769281 RepID=UPI00178275AA|nr:hypothetical protein [Ensifer sp. ENS04]MBD9540097.1 hypothetical protein [Ensifer sp. ENS04]